MSWLVSSYRQSKMHLKDNCLIKFLCKYGWEISQVRKKLLMKLYTFCCLWKTMSWLTSSYRQSKMRPRANCLIKFLVHTWLGNISGFEEASNEVAIVLILVKLDVAMLPQVCAQITSRKQVFHKIPEVFITTCCTLRPISSLIASGSLPKAAFFWHSPIGTGLSH